MDLKLEINKVYRRIDKLLQISLLDLLSPPVLMRAGMIYICVTFISCLAFAPLYGYKAVPELKST